MNERNEDERYELADTAEAGARTGGDDVEGHARRLDSVLPAVAAAIGSPVPTAIHPDGERLREALGLPHARSAVVVLIDGLGFWNLAERAGHAPTLRSLLRDGANAMPARTCYPSTTVAALASFGTGTCPGLTGMLGYTQLNPATGRLAQMIQWDGAEDPERLQTRPTVFESLAKAGVRATSVSLGKFRDSPLTRAVLRGSDYRGAEDPLERIGLIAGASREPGLTYVYVRDIDKTGHNHGWLSERWSSRLERVDARLGLLRRSLPKGTLLVVTADHGMIVPDLEHAVDIAADPVLKEGVRLVGGEPRALMLYADEGTAPDGLADRWRSRLAQLDVPSRVLTRAEALGAGLFGPSTEASRAAMGDVMVMCSGHAVIVDSRIQNERARTLPSVHGSLTPFERDIPLLADVV